MIATKKSHGFTLVEIMVVVAVLAILFAIVVLSYGNWREVTASKEVSNDLKAAASALKNYQTYNNTFPSPPTLPDSFQPSQHVTVEYKTGSSNTFCLIGTSNVLSDVKYKITEKTDPAPGSTCP